MQLTSDDDIDEESEKKIIDSIDDKRLAELFLPAIKAVIRNGGGAEAILKNSEAMAAARLSTTALEGKSDLALKAAIEILNRTQGRPVERRLNVYADVAEMSEEQLDREIYQLAQKAGVTEILANVIAAPAVKEKKELKAKRRAACRTTDLTKRDDEPGE